MLKTLTYIVVVVVGLYIILQIPFVAEFADDLRNSVIEKRENVVEEYNRVKGKVDDVTDKVIETKEKVEDTVDTVGDVVDTVSDTADKIGDLVGEEEEEIEEIEEVEDEPVAGETCTEEEKAVGIMCPDNYAPVCGDDGATYGNACKACASGNIDTYVQGECVMEESISREI